MELPFHQAESIMRLSWATPGAWLFPGLTHSERSWGELRWDGGCFQEVVQGGRSMSLTRCPVLGLCPAGQAACTSSHG